MRTKKEIRETYLEQKSMNRITDPIIVSAITLIGSDQAKGYMVMPTVNIVVDYAYSIEHGLLDFEIKK